ncbi:MAG: DUF1223 domain-containing protein [Pseudomonadota bacterium]
MFALLPSLAAAAVLVGEARKPEAGPETAAGDDQLVVVELFLSQACMKCPPAAAHLKELAARRDILPLSWHVDYWDALSSRKNGRWTDPYAQSAFSARQRAYNLNLTGRAKVFTPQAVVDGAQSVVGSRRTSLEKRIAMAAERPAGEQFVRIDKEMISADAGVQPHDVLLVTFLPDVKTHVTAGANKDHVFHEENVVTGVRVLAAGVVGPVRAPSDAMHGLGDGEDCAVLLQAIDTGAIAAATRCADIAGDDYSASLSSSGTP